MMVRIMGARTGFGMVLNAENRLLAMLEGRHSAVVEVEMGDFNRFRRQ